jgi:acetolactate synthase-1/2/3 large subunit
VYACGELATLVQERMPVTIVLVDDRGYGMLRFDQTQAGEEPCGVDLATPDFEALAGAFGVPASTVDRSAPSSRRLCKVRSPARRRA